VRVRAETQGAIDDWWRELFQTGDELWSSVTVLQPHGLLEDYDGWYVAWRGAGVHVSAPSHADAGEVASLRDVPALELQAPEFWHAFARQRGLEVIGPGMHRYLDAAPGPVGDVREVAPSELRTLRERVTLADWWESGFDDALDEPGAVALAADHGAAVLTDLAGAPRNIGVLVAQDARGRGVGTELGRAAASYAVRHHGYARWRSRDTNVASTRAARRLGFEPYATQLAVRARSGSSGA